MDRNKKRVQTVSKPAVLPLATTEVLRREPAEELNLEAIQLRQIRTRFEMMEDMSVFEFAITLTNDAHKKESRSLEETVSVPTAVSRSSDAIATEMQPGLETRLRNALQKGLSAGEAAFSGIKFIVKMSQQIVAAQSDQDERARLIGQIIGLLATGVGPQFPAVAQGWIAMQPALKEILLLIDAYYVYKSALKRVQSGEECDFGTKSAAKIAVMEHAQTRLRAELIQMQAEVTQLQGTLRQRQDEADKVRSQLEDEQKRGERTKKQVENIMQINASMSQTIEQLQAASKQNQVTVQELRLQLEETERQRLSAVQAWDASEKAKYEAVQDKQRYQKQIGEEQQIQETLSKQIRQLQEENGALQHMNGERAKEVEDLKDDLEERAAELSVLRAQVKDMKVREESLEAQLKDATKQRDVAVTARVLAENQLKRDQASEQAREASRSEQAREVQQASKSEQARQVHVERTETRRVESVRQPVASKQPATSLQAPKDANKDPQKDGGGNGRQTSRDAGNHKVEGKSSSHDKQESRRSLSRKASTRASPPNTSRSKSRRRTSESPPKSKRHITVVKPKSDGCAIV